ncbi:MAG: hypothetical protein V4565_13730 [Bacteroidota bacterium]
MSCIKYLFIGLFLIANNLICQTANIIPTKLMVSPDKVKGQLNVEFDNEKQVDNLLVILTDSTGKTVFLENLYRFKGFYKKNIDLPYKGRGNVSLHIIKDEEKIIKKISLK